MKNRRTFLLALTSGLVALVMIVAPVIADELFGVITKVDVAGKTVTVVEKGSDKEIVVTTTDDTDWITPKGSRKIDLEKLDTYVKKQQDEGKKGIRVQVTHEKGVASKIAVAAKKKEASKD